MLQFKFKKTPANRFRLGWKYFSLGLKSLSKNNFIKNNRAGRGCFGSILTLTGGRSVSKRLVKYPDKANNLGLCFLIIGVNYNKNSKRFYYNCKSIYGKFQLSLVHGLIIGNYVNNINLSYLFLNTLGLGAKIPLLYSTGGLIYSNLFNNLSNYAVYSRSSGVFFKVLAKWNNVGLALILLPSQKKKIVSIYYLTLVGRNSNIFYKFNSYGGASLLKLNAKKSIVRGVAKNPVDHPHGGRTKTNCPEVSPWGWVTKHSH